jgi:hypothetical protein
VLMGMNAIGAYGFLARAHIGHQVDSDVLAAGRSADVDARLSVQAGVVADIDRRIAQIDGVVEKATSKGHTGSAMALADQQRKTRAELVAQRTSEAKALAGLQVEKTSIDGDRRKAEADLGRFAISRPCSAPATRTSCATSSWSWRCCLIQQRCCCCWPRLRPDDQAPRDSRKNVNRPRAGYSGPLFAWCDVNPPGKANGAHRRTNPNFIALGVTGLTSGAFNPVLSYRCSN